MALASESQPIFFGIPCSHATHQRLKRDAVAWHTLAFVGFQPASGGGWLELRNCPCGSTLSVPRSTLPEE